jgi:hypothetical protein
MSAQSAEALKTWLLRLQEAIADAELTEERLDTLRSRAEAPRGSNLDGMPHSSGFAGDKIGTLVSQIEDLTEENTQLWRRVAELRREREAAIRRIECRGYAELRSVLRLRYIDGENWNDLCFVLYGGKEDFSEREDSYMRRAYKLHGKALYELSKIVPLETGQEIICGKDE